MNICSSLTLLNIKNNTRDRRNIRKNEKNTTFEQGFLGDEDSLIERNLKWNIRRKNSIPRQLSMKPNPCRMLAMTMWWCLDQPNCIACPASSHHLPASTLGCSRNKQTVQPLEFLHVVRSSLKIPSINIEVNWQICFFFFFSFLQK